MKLDTSLSGASAAEVVRDLMPQLKADLARLVAIPSVSVLGYPEHTRPALQETYDAVVELLHDAGVDNVESLDLPDAAPIVTAELPAPPGAPTVLLYGHYDVAPGRRGGEVGLAAVRGERARRGDLRPRRPPTRSRTSSSTSARCAPGAGRPPVGIKIVIEGQEETGSAFTSYPQTRPRAVRLRRDGDRRHGQRPPGRADADRRRCAAWRR